LHSDTSGGLCSAYSDYYHSLAIHRFALASENARFVHRDTPAAVRALPAGSAPAANVYHDNLDFIRLESNTHRPC